MANAVEPFVAMRLATLASVPGFRPGAPAVAFLTSLYRRGLSLGLVECRTEGLGQLVFFRDPAVWYGGSATLAFIDRAPTEAGLFCVLAAVDAHAASLGDDAFLQIDAADDALREGLLARGFGVDSVVLGGSRALAAARLGVASPPKGARLVPVSREPRAIPGIIELHRDVFSRAPEYCWFGAHPEHLATFEADLRKQPAGHFVIADGPRILGHLGVEVRDDPCFGPTAGLEIVLAPELRRRGLTRWLYSEALRDMAPRGAETLKGGTAQPAILHLARVLGRPWLFLNLRRRVHFDFAHFAAFRGP